MDFHTLRDALEHEYMPAIISPVSGSSVQLKVALELDGFAEPLVLQIAQVETDAQAMADLDMLQLYVPIPLTVSEQALLPLLAVLAGINQTAPLVGLNLQLEERFVYFRHVMLVPQTEVAVAMVTHAVWLTRFLLDMNAATLLSGAAPHSEE